ncbi:MAG: sugar kinase, partial [Anaerolineae bacterium]|nr:sugar kinase [Anaerolineae bacterium]
PNGERPALHVLGANAKYSLEDVNWDIIKNADYLHFGGTYLLAMLDGEPTAEVLKFAQKHGVVTTLDMIALQRDDLLEIIEPALPYIDYFMPGLEEARMICKLEDRQAVIDFFLSRGAKHTVFKMGAQGSSIAGKDMAEIRVPAFKMNVVDSTGCGDAYCAAFIVGMSQGWSLEQAGRFASAASGLVITGLGSDAGIVDFDHTLNVMNTYDSIPMDE